MAADVLWSFVIPVFRSEAYLADTVGALLEALGPHRRVEIVLVNDASPDGVQTVIDRLCASDARIRSVTLGVNAGQHRAVLCGLAECRGDVVITIDDDGQNPPSAALAVGERLQATDLDVVYGAFDAAARSTSRRLASGVNRWMSRYALPNPHDIPHSNVRAIRGDLARHMAQVASPYPYVDALIFRMTQRIGSVPVEYRARTTGESGYRVGPLVSLWVSHLTTLSVLPLRLAVFASFTISGLGFLAGAALTARALMLGGAPPGWLSLFCAVTFLFSVLFALLGVVSVYVGRLYVASNERGTLWVRSRSVDEPRRDPAEKGV